MVDENEFHRRVQENLDALGGRPLNPKGAELLGGYPLIVEAKMIKAKAKHAGFLGGEDIGLLSIDREIRRKYKDFPVLKNGLPYENGVIKGSYPFYIVAVNEMLGEGRRTANHADIEKIRESGILDLSGVFVDTALVLRSAARPNKYLAGKLRKQIRARFPCKLLSPMMLPLTGLELEPDQNSRHGLAFKLRDYAHMMVWAPQLSGENNNKRFSKTDEDGLPIFDEKGTRVLHTRESGLSRLYLSNGDLHSDFNYLECSGAYGAGRVVIVND